MLLISEFTTSTFAEKTYNFQTLDVTEKFSKKIALNSTVELKILELRE